MTKHSTDSCVKKSVKKIALFSGAGAVINAWNPINRVIEERLGLKGLTDDAANCFLARTIYLCRFVATLVDETKEKKLKAAKDSRAEFVRRFGEELIGSQRNGELATRAELLPLLEDIAGPHQDLLDILLVNTN